MAGIAAKMITARNAAQCYLVQLATRMVEKMPIEKSQGAAMIPRARQPSIPRNDTSENKNDQKWQWEDSGTRALIRTLCIGVAIWTFGQNHADASAENKKVAKVVPATQLHGKWKKVEEVGQDKALLQVDTDSATSECRFVLLLLIPLSWPMQMSLNWVFRSAATLLT